MYANQHLVLAGISIEIFEKSNADLGLVQEPTIHEGDVAWNMEQEGRSSARVDINQNVKARNERTLALQDIEGKLERIEQHRLI